MFKENKLQQETLFYFSDRPLTFGDVVYRIEPGERAYFDSTCGLCDGKGELTLNGTTINCPMCKSSKVSITATKYLARRYRVYGFNDEVGRLRWKKDELHRITIKFYRRLAIGELDFDDSSDRGGEFEMRPEGINWNITGLSIQDEQELDLVLFDDYELAVKVADDLTAQSLERLQIHNKRHGMSHVAVFQKTHDPKSK